MRGLVPRIHVFLTEYKGVDGRDIGERSDAVLRTAMPAMTFPIDDMALHSSACAGSFVARGCGIRDEPMKNTSGIVARVSHISSLKSLA